MLRAATRLLMKPLPDLGLSLGGIELCSLIATGHRACRPYTWVPLLDRCTNTHHDRVKTNRPLLLSCPVATVSVTLAVVREESAVHRTITPGNWIQVSFGCRGLARAYGPGRVTSAVLVATDECTGQTKLPTAKVTCGVSLAQP